MVRDRDLGREPCPDRIVEDLGGAFGMGCIGGFLWYTIKGARNSPKGERWHGAMYLAKGRSPVLGGAFAVWGGTFSTFDCTLQFLRQREDHWNAIASGFLTGGVLAARAGIKSASRNAVVGGVLLGIIEGVAALTPKMMAQTPRTQYEQHLEQEKQQKAYVEKQEARKLAKANGEGSMWDTVNSTLGFGEGGAGSEMVNSLTPSVNGMSGGGEMMSDADMNTMNSINSMATPSSSSSGGGGSGNAPNGEGNSWW